MRKNGFAFVYIIIVLSVVGLIGVGYLGLKKSKIDLKLPNIANFKPSQSPTPTPSPFASPKPTVQAGTPTPTIKPTPRPTKKPVIPTVSPAPVADNGCSKFKPADGLTTLTITLKEKDGNALAGDWVVKISPSGACPGSLPPNWGSQINDVIKQPKYTYTSAGLGPGKFRVDVNYHTSGEGFDWDGVSGNTTREVTVSN